MPLDILLKIVYIFLSFTLFSGLKPVHPRREDLIRTG